MTQLLKAAAVSAACLLPAIAANSATFTSYVAFGDSLSDDGKLGLPEPYFDGRFSSGPVWTDFIGQRFDYAGLPTFNFALGGATAGDANINSNGIFVESLDPALNDPEYPAILQPFATFNRQIDVLASLNPAAILGDNPLVSVLLGANDIFQGGNPIDAANAVADGIQRVIDLAPTLNDFLVSTLPQLGDAPALDGKTIADRFNEVLDTRLSVYDGTNINIIDLNQDIFRAELFPQLASLGVTNLTEPCLVAPTLTSPASDCTITGFEPDGTPIRDLSIADTYYLIDSVHPSGPVQAAFGAFAIETLGSSLPAPVPLPAALPLMLVGVAGFGLVARRRKTAS